MTNNATAHRTTPKERSCPQIWLARLLERLGRFTSFPKLSNPIDLQSIFGTCKFPAWAIVYFVIQRLSERLDTFALRGISGAYAATV